MIFQRLSSILLKIRSFCCKQKTQLISVAKPESHILVGCGNPLLDILATVNHEFLEKYDLKLDQAIMAEKKHSELFRDLSKTYNVEYIAGGSVQNSLRAFQWILQKPYSSAFFGSVGNDENGKILQKKAHEDGVVVRYETKKESPTGTCAVLITGHSRTMVADLGAAEKFSIDYLNNGENWSLIEQAKYFYISGYFLAVCEPCAIKVAKHALDCNHCFAFNLSAMYIPKLFMRQLKELIPYVDILFGSDMEADAFALTEGWQITDRKLIGTRLQRMHKLNDKRPRIVIITQAHLPILMIMQSSVEEFVVPRMDNSSIVDTSGAGDGFVGGFLAQYIQGKSLDICIRCGIYTAQYIIGQSGCTFNGNPNFSD